MSQTPFTPEHDFYRAFQDMKLHVDYRLYLVTDSTDAILHGRDLCDVVKKALLGGMSSSMMS